MTRNVMAFCGLNISITKDSKDTALCWMKSVQLFCSEERGGQDFRNFDKTMSEYNLCWDKEKCITLFKVPLK